LLTGFILGIVALAKMGVSKRKLRGRGFAIFSIAICFFAALVGPGIASRIQLSNRFRCSHNIVQLGRAMLYYAGHSDWRLPTQDRWCDLLVEHAEASKDIFICPGSHEEVGESSYALNENIVEVPDSGDIVLLFESIPGWNQFGGPELLSTENHNGEGCNIVFCDSHGEFVRKERLGELKWEVEEEEENGSGNFRRPDNDGELKYWLGNMVWYHLFTNEEIRAATGLTESEIVAALAKFNIRPDNRPRRAEDAPLLVLPYPGGRHPRIGFLDGAIDPQRETKFSVFTPWDVHSYVVVDVPEAIWSNLGLTYLAHTHIDTIWTKQDIILPRLEWNRHPDGTLDIERKLPNGIAFGMKVKPTKEAVLMELWLKNGTDEKLSDLRVQNCVMTKMATGFEQQSNDNKVLTNPYVACRSGDGKRWIITAWEKCNNPWANDKCPCFHSDPKFPDTEPGQTHRLRGWLSFYEGTDIEAEFKRIEATGWRKK
jgi:hypothetical protein